MRWEWILWKTTQEHQFASSNNVFIDVYWEYLYWNNSFDDVCFYHFQLIRIKKASRASAVPIWKKCINTHKSFNKQINCDSFRLLIEIAQITTEKQKSDNWFALFVIDVMW